MAETTGIEWCDKTWSPWIGCTKVSVGPQGGCVNCYAEGLDKRFHHGEHWGPGAPRRKTADWTKPRLWNRKAAKAGITETVFPSMCDPFDNEVDPAWRTEFFALIRATPNLTWLLLTKRIGNVEAMVAEAGGWSANARLGITACNQPELDRDLPKAMDTKGELDIECLFLSLEPLLGPINFDNEDFSTWCPDCEDFHAGQQRTNGVDHVIVGGESGHGARPMHPQWARDIRDQCERAGTPFLFKQWGELAPNQRTMAEVRASGRPLVPVPLRDSCPFPAELMDRVGKKAAGRLLDGRTHDEFPEVRHG